VIGIVSVFLLPEPVGTPLTGSGPTVQSEAEADAVAEETGSQEE